MTTHLVVIDDDAAARLSASALFRSHDYRVSSFDSAEAYLEADVDSPIGCMLLDVHLPGISGRELLGRLKAGGCQFPIVLISGLTDATSVEEAKREGAAEVLSKPISPSDLVEHVQRAIEVANGSPA